MELMMESFLMEDNKNTIAMPFILEASAVVSAPADYIRILDTGGKKKGFVVPIY